MSVKIGILHPNCRLEYQTPFGLGFFLFILRGAGGVHLTYTKQFLACG